MRPITKALALTALAAAFAAAPLVQAGDDIKPNQYMAKPDKQGMMTKEEVMKMVDKMFDKHDSKKTGKLDKKQYEIFLQELMKSSG